MALEVITRQGLNILSPRCRAALTLDLTSSDNLSQGLGMVNDFESGVEAANVKRKTFK